MIAVLAGSQCSNSSSIVHELVVVNHSKIYLWLNLDTPKILTCLMVAKVMNKYGELNILFSCYCCCTDVWMLIHKYWRKW